MEERTESLWRCDGCGETFASDTPFFPKGEAWHAHTKTYSKVDGDGSVVGTVREDEWRAERDADNMLVSPVPALLFAIAVIVILCPVLHYRKLDREYGDSISKQGKVALTAASMAAACAAGALIGSRFGRKLSPKNG